MALPRRHPATRRSPARTDPPTGLVARNRVDLPAPQHQHRGFARAAPVFARAAPACRARRQRPPAPGLAAWPPALHHRGMARPRPGLLPRTAGERRSGRLHRPTVAGSAPVTGFSVTPGFIAGEGRRLDRGWSCPALPVTMGGRRAAPRARSTAWAAGPSGAGGPVECQNSAVIFGEGFYAEVPPHTVPGATSRCARSAGGSSQMSAARTARRRGPAGPGMSPAEHGYPCRGTSSPMSVAAGGRLIRTNQPAEPGEDQVEQAKGHRRSSCPAGAPGASVQLTGQDDFWHPTAPPRRGQGPHPGRQPAPRPDHHFPQALREQLAALPGNPRALASRPRSVTHHPARTDPSRRAAGEAQLQVSVRIHGDPPEERS